MRRCRPVLLLVLLVMVGGQSLVLCQSKPQPKQQTKPRKAAPASTATTQARRIMLWIGGGFGTATTRDGIKQFWTGGPAGSIGLLFRVKESFAAGIGFEGAFLPFNETAFAAAYPTVPLHHHDVGLLHLFLEAKYMPFWKYRFAPYVAGTIGAARLTNAEYYDVIDSVRVTYYRIRGTPRLAAGMAIGTDVMLSRTVSLWAEVKGTYIHNDPNIGLWTSLIGGVRFVL